MRHTKKTVALALAGLSLLALAACVPPAARPGASRMKVVARLDCPDRQGQLVRASAASDGKSCTYADGEDVQVQLKLIPINVDAETTLQPIEDELRKLAPIDDDGDAAGDADQTPVPDRPTGATPTPPTPPVPPTPPKDRDRGQVDINLPGVHIHAGDERANIRVGGIHIDADDRTNSAHIRGRHGRHGDFSVDASDGGAVVRSRSRGPDVRQTLVLASDKPGPEGWRAVGYEAHGPRNGPLVVAVVQSKDDDRDDLFNEVKALVRRNAGG